MCLEHAQAFASFTSLHGKILAQEYAPELHSALNQKCRHVICTIAPAHAQ